MADELGQLQRDYAIALAPWEGRLQRIAALEKALRLACTARPEDPWVVEGRRYLVRLGAAGQQRTVNISRLIRTIGARAFHKFASCTLKDLEAHCDRETVADVVTTSLSGPRRITTEEKGA